MRKFIFVVCLFLLSINILEACRFTVREIGYSTLSRDMYSLVVLDENVNATDVYWNSVHRKLHESNIRLSVLNPFADRQHPFAKQIIASNISLPAYVLIAPNGRMLILNHNKFELALKEVFDSPIRKNLYEDIPSVFSVLLWVDGEDETVHKSTARIISESVSQIENMMPHMPKEVKKGPLTYRITKEIYSKERVLMWALGLDEFPKRPVAFVFYGRGRIMGDVASFSEIKNGKLYKLMSMIGADCECGLDRKWMLGNQIPLLWAADTRQILVDELNFDVDNPMILAEMSRILAKETDANVAGDIGFGPEEINLDEAFDEIPELTFDENIKESNAWMFYLMGLVLFILSIGLFLFFRNKSQ